MEKHNAYRNNDIPPLTLAVQKMERYVIGVFKTRLVLLKSRSVTAPKHKRSVVKLIGSILVDDSARRQNNEFAANATIAVAIQK